MIKNESEIRVREVKNAQGGNGSVFFHDWMLPEESYGHGRLFAKLVLPPGATIGLHEHHHEFEAMYVIKGTATVLEDGKAIELAEGGMNICPESGAHGLENRTNEDLVLIALVMNA